MSSENAETRPHIQFDVEKATRHALRSRITGYDAQNDSLAISRAKIEEIMAENRKQRIDAASKLADLELKDLGLEGLRQKLNKNASKLTRSRTPMLANLGRLTSGVLSSELVEFLPEVVEDLGLEPHKRIWIGDRNDLLELVLQKDGSIGLARHEENKTWLVMSVDSRRGKFSTFSRFELDGKTILLDTGIDESMLGFHDGFIDMNTLMVNAETVSYKPEGKRPSVVPNTFHNFAATAE